MVSASISRWMTGVLGGGNVQFRVVRPPVGVPIKNTRSDSATARLAGACEYSPTQPMQRGSAWVITLLALSEVATGICILRANARNELPAWDDWRSEEHTSELQSLR